MPAGSAAAAGMFGSVRIQLRAAAGQRHSRAPAGKSQRDFIIQPSVAAMQSWLRWVANRNDINPEWVESLRAKQRYNPVGVENILTGDLG